MNIRNKISKKNAALAGYSRRCGILLRLLLVFICSRGLVSAQDITVTGAVINVPAGVHLTTGGGLTLQDDGAIQNDGTIALKGDWVNNGKGLLEEGEGTVVLDGENQAIAGENTTTFRDLKLAGKDVKELGQDIVVTGKLEIHNCYLFTHEFTFALLDQSPLNFLWENGGIASGDDQARLLEEPGISAVCSAGGARSRLVEGQVVAVAVSGPNRVRWQEGNPSVRATIALKKDQKSGLRHLQATQYDLRNEHIFDGAMRANLTIHYASRLDGRDSGFNGHGQFDCGCTFAILCNNLYSTPSRGSRTVCPATASSFSG